MHTHLGRRRQDATALGARRVALDRRRRRPSGSAGSTSRDARSRAATSCERLRRRRAPRRGFTHALLLGMGGSSLCPEVLARDVRPAGGLPELHVLDSTDPAQVRAFEQPRRPRAHARHRRRASPAARSSRTSSSSTSSTRMAALVGAATRPASASSPSPIRARRSSSRRRGGGFRHDLPRRADDRRTLLGAVAFGLVPAAVMGLDVERFLERAQRDGRAPAAPDAPATRTPASCSASLLGAARAHAAATSSRSSPRPASRRSARGSSSSSPSRPASTARRSSRSIASRSARPTRYGADRVFVVSAPRDRAGRRAGRASSTRSPRAGQPVVRIDVRDADRPRRRSSSAGRSRRRSRARSCGINPFDQPDVEASKIATRELTDRLRARRARCRPKSRSRRTAGSCSSPTPRTPTALRGGAAATRRRRICAAHLAPHRRRRLLRAAGLRRDERAPRRRRCRRIRHAVRDRRGVATCLGFGPRFLHSTGQAYKGGPNSGVVPADHLRRRARSAGAGPRVHVRRGQGGAGARRLRRARRARPPRAARPPRRATWRAGLRAASRAIARIASARDRGAST